MTDTDRFNSFLPFAGVLSAVAMGAGFALSGSDLADDASPQTIVARYSDNFTAGMVGSFATVVLFSAFFLFFATALRAVLRSGEAREAIYSTLAISGAIGMALSIAIDGAMTTATFSAAHNGYESSVVPLHLMASYTFIPWMAFAAAFFVSVGLGGLRTRTLPKWFSIVTLVIGILCFSPLGIIGYMLQPIWLLTCSVILIQAASSRNRARSSAVTNSSGVSSSMSRT